jgi:hypothetical protein
MTISQMTTKPIDSLGREAHNQVMTNTASESTTFSQIMIANENLFVVWHGISRHAALVFLADEIGFSLQADTAIVIVQHPGYGNSFYSPAEFAAWFFATPASVEYAPSL